jgi:hypothetical protein
MVKTCTARGIRDVSIQVDRVKASKQDVEELGKMLNTLGFKVLTRSSCDTKERIGGLNIRLGDSEDTIYVDCLY